MCFALILLAQHAGLGSHGASATKSGASHSGRLCDITTTVTAQQTQKVSQGRPYIPVYQAGFEEAFQGRDFRYPAQHLNRQRCRLAIVCSRRMMVSSRRGGGHLVRKHQKCEPRNGSFAFIHIQIRFKAHRYGGYCWNHAFGACSKLCAPHRYVETGCRSCTLRRQTWLKHSNTKASAGWPIANGIRASPGVAGKSGKVWGCTIHDGSNS